MSAYIQDIEGVMGEGSHIRLCVRMTTTLRRTVCGPSSRDVQSAKWHEYEDD